MFAGRGFTAQEYLEDFDLINMNGRLGVYPVECNETGKPVVGRMLSPDAMVQNTGNTQNFNRYSYCLNNPLKSTDPSGSKYHFIEQTWWAPGAGTFFGNSSGGGGPLPRILTVGMQMEVSLAHIAMIIIPGNIQTISGMRFPLTK